MRVFRMHREAYAIQFRFTKRMEYLMNKEQISGKFDQAAGKLKQKLGESIGNQKTANEGVAEQIKGAAKETWGHVKDTANEANKTAQARQNAEGDRVRENVSSATQNVKDRIDSKLDQLRDDAQDERENIERTN